MLQTDSLSGIDATPAIPCVIYAAKSTEDKRGSIAGQLDDCRQLLAGSPERTIVAKYADEACSAYTGNRGPQLADAMQHAEDLSAEHGSAELWVQHSDRLARGDGQSARHTVEIALWALKCSVKVCTIQDPDTFRDLLYAVVTGQRNHEDSRRKSLSVQAGRRRAAARGDFIGYRPDGYRIAISLDEHGAITKRMEIDPEREPIIRALFDRALRGQRPAAIAKAMNAAGWTTKPYLRTHGPLPWSTGRVIEKLVNPRYAGLALYGGEIVARGHWPAYITERQHLRLKANYTKRRPTKAPRQLETYLLAKLARCQRCGGRLLVATGLERRDGTFARRYKCASRWLHRGAGRCTTVSIEAELLEATFVSSLRVLLLDHPSAEARTPHQLSALGVTASSRRELVDGVLAGDDQRVDFAIERLFAEMQPQARATRRSRRLHRELDLVARIEEWAEQERVGRTEQSRREARELNRSLRGLFTEVHVWADEAEVRFIVRRRASEQQPISAPVAATVDLREWTRYAPLARRTTRRSKWTEAQIIGALQAWSDEHGRAPRWRDFKRPGGGYPSAQTVLFYSGGWEAALCEAGLCVTSAAKHRS